MHGREEVLGQGLGLGPGSLAPTAPLSKLGKATFRVHLGLMGNLFCHRAHGVEGRERG